MRGGQRFFLGSLIGALAVAAVTNAQSTPPPGEALWQARCAACHTLYPPPKAAPPAMGIVMHYSETYRTRDQFVDAVARWVAAPSKDKTHMPPHAIEKFGVMPPLGFPDAEVRVIAAWMWDEFTGRKGRTGPP